MGHVTPAVRERIVDLRGQSQERVARSIGESDGVRVYVTDAVNMEVSATMIRQAVREGHEGAWPRLVQPAVADYIRKYGLYKEA